MEKEDFLLGPAKYNQLGLNEELNKYEPVDYNFDINNKNDSHALLAKRVTKNASVLDVGCASGIIGRLLKENKTENIDGIERDKISYEIAKKSTIYNEVFQFSVTEEASISYQKFFSNQKKYDFIIFADVLEHLEKPYEVIYNFTKKLKPEGKMLISIPNVNHIEMIKNLFNNEFNYNHVGLLDSTHLRFFTNTSFFQMIENINKTYEIALSVNYFGKTTFKSNYINELDYFRKEHFAIIQNLFELTLEKSKESIKYVHRPKKINDFNNFINEFSELKKEKVRQEEEIERLKNELHKVYTSKRYRFISKIADFKNNIKRR